MGAHMAAELVEMKLVPHRSRILLTSILFACLRVSVAPTAGWCEDVLKVAVGAPNNWDSSVPDVVRDEFMPKAAMTPDRVSDVAAITKDAIGFSFMQGPLTQAQLTELIQTRAVLLSMPPLAVDRLETEFCQ